MTGSQPSGANPPGKDEEADGLQRLHRDPANVDGLKPDKIDDHEPAKALDERAEEAGKPYSTETESYGEGTIRGPEDPVRRQESRTPPRR